MAADIIKVSSEEMRAAVSSFKNCQTELENAYLTMSNAVRAVDTTWNGEASEAFKNQFDSLYKNIEQTEAKVQDAIDEVSKAAEIYDQAEKALESAFGGLDVGTSPFNS